MNADNNKKDSVNEIINALGILAETSLVFYRNVITSGATQDEAFKLTQAFISASIFGINSNPNA